MFTAAEIANWATLLGVVLTGIAGIITAFRMGRVETSVNSAATAQLALNASLQKQNEMLKEALATQVQAAALLAQAQVRQAPTNPSTTEGEHLQQIEVNTDATAKNTARTDIAVKKLDKKRTQ